MKMFIQIFDQGVCCTLASTPRDTSKDSGTSFLTTTGAVYSFGSAWLHRFHIHGHYDYKGCLMR